MKRGDHVNADRGEGIELAHVLDGSVATDEGDKVRVQFGDGSAHLLAHREPADRDERGPGGTCWKIA